MFTTKQTIQPHDKIWLFFQVVVEQLKYVLLMNMHNKSTKCLN